MDEKDLLLLQLLEENSRVSVDELSVMTEISARDVEVQDTLLLRRPR